MNRYKPKGWRNESLRHSLASKGIKTKTSLIPLSKDDQYYYIRKNFPDKDFDKDGVRNRDDCKPLDPYEQGKVHDFFEQLIRTKKRQFPEHKRELEKAQKQIKKITTIEEVKKWVVDHKKALQLTGLTILLILISEASGGAGVLVQRISTGEIIAVGGSVIGRGLQPMIAIAGGVAGGEGLTEAIQEGQKELKETI